MSAIHRAIQNGFDIVVQLRKCRSFPRLHARLLQLLRDVFYSARLLWLWLRAFRYSLYSFAWRRELRTNLLTFRQLDLCQHGIAAADLRQELALAHCRRAAWRAPSHCCFTVPSGLNNLIIEASSCNRL